VGMNEAGDRGWLGPKLGPLFYQVEQPAAYRIVYRHGN
jgi:hypothetical protein